jgi:release factor glutamine methyltransferase
VPKRSPPSSRSSSLSAKRTTELPLVDRPDGSALVERLRNAGCVFAEDEAEVLLASAGTLAELEHMVHRRVAGIPLEQVVGWAEFAGIRIAIDPGVFVPRRRTELLLWHAVSLAPSRPVIVELCCGSAAVSVALATTLTDVELYAVDIDPAAVQCASRNLAPLPGRTAVLEGDLYAPLRPSLAGRIDVLLANAPYVPTEAISLMPQEARRYEPQIAHDGGSDGLEVYRRIAAEANHWLAPDGHLLVETSLRQAADTAAIMNHRGLATEVIRSDEMDATAVIGRRPATRELGSKSRTRDH